MWNFLLRFGEGSSNVELALRMKYNRRRHSSYGENRGIVAFFFPVCWPALGRAASMSTTTTMTTRTTGLGASGNLATLSCWVLLQGLSGRRTLSNHRPSFRFLEGEILTGGIPLAWLFLSPLQAGLRFLECPPFDSSTLRNLLFVLLKGNW